MMNRRKAIRSILGLGAAGLAAAGGYTWFRLYKEPDISQLEAYKPLIDELVEIIIPETDTPGAKAAGVGDFVITMVRDCSSRKVQNRFMYGLEDIEQYAMSQYRRSFLECTPGTRSAIVDHFERWNRPYKGITGKVIHRLAGSSFFVTLKKYTALGYCTSMKGATMGLSYDYIPGQYKGCVPVTPGQRCWAT